MKLCSAIISLNAYKKIRYNKIYPKDFNDVKWFLNKAIRDRIIITHVKNARCVSKYIPASYLILEDRINIIDVDGNVIKIDLLDKQIIEFDSSGEKDCICFSSEGLHVWMVLEIEDKLNEIYKKYYLNEKIKWENMKNFS